MQRILYCTDSLMAGGTEHQLVELIVRLDRSRFEPYVVCLYGARAGRSLHFLERLQWQHVPVALLDLGWGASDKLAAVAGIVREARRIRPQIIHAVNYHSSLLMRLARPFLPGSIKLVSSVYVPYTPTQLFYERLSGWLCAAVVCNSPQIERQLVPILPAGRVHHIPNGVDLARFAANSDPTLRQRLAPSASRVLIVSGRISRQKAPYLVAEALGRLKQRGRLPSDLSVWFVGESEEVEAQRQLEEVIRRFDLAPFVRQFPPTDQPEAYYHAADVIVQVSLWEGLPNTLLESFAAGRPVVVSEAANAAGVVEHNVNGWIVRTGDIDDLADRLGAVFALPGEDLQAMQAACRMTAASFVMEQMIAAYAALYDRLTASL